MRALIAPLTFLTALILTALCIISGYSGGELRVYLKEGDYPPIVGRVTSYGDEVGYEITAYDGRVTYSKPIVGEYEYPYSVIHGIDAPNLHISIMIEVPSDAKVKVLNEFSLDGGRITPKRVITDKIAYRYVLTKPGLDSTVVNDGLYELAKKDMISLGSVTKIYESPDGIELEYRIVNDPFANTYTSTDDPAFIISGGEKLTPDRYGAWYADGRLYYYDSLAGKFFRAGIELGYESAIADYAADGEIVWLIEDKDVLYFADFDGESLDFYRYDGSLSKPYRVKASVGEYETLRVTGVISNGALCIRAQVSPHIYAGGRTHYAALSLKDMSPLLSGDCDIVTNEGMLFVAYDEWQDFDAYFDGTYMYALDNCRYMISLPTERNVTNWYINRDLLNTYGGGIVSRQVTLTKLGADGVISQVNPLKLELSAIGGSYAVELAFSKAR